MRDQELSDREKLEHIRLRNQMRREDVALNEEEMKQKKSRPPGKLQRVGGVVERKAENALRELILGK